MSATASHTQSVRLPQSQRRHTPSAPRDWPYHLAALAIVLAVAALRYAFLWNTTSLSLTSDEAHYWDWSRHLDYCYYSKGPLVAWLIRASCWIGESDTMLAVRLPAICLSALTLIGVYILIFRIFRDPRFAVIALLGAQTLPVLQVGGILMTIDAPYVCAWTWAVVLSHIILFPGNGSGVPCSAGSCRGVPCSAGATGEHANVNRSSTFLWFLLGLIVALGVLAKHNMALFVPSLALFLLVSPTHRRELFRPGFWLMAATGALLGGGPILWWNAQHDWVTFLHVGAQAGIQESAPSIRWWGPLEFLATQAGVLLVFWFILMAIGLVKVFRRWRQGEVSPDLIFMAVLTLPIFLVCLAFSLKVRIEPNWPITGYITGLVLAAWALREKWQQPRWRRAALGFGFAGILLSLLVHYSHWLYPLHAKLFPETSVRKWDATCRLKGWSTLGNAVHDLAMSQTHPPLLFGSNWSLTGALAFHLPDQPTVYCLGPAAGSRHSQYDLWRPNPLADPEQFAGRDAIIVGDLSPQIRSAFASIEPTKFIQATDHGLIVATWPVTIARGLKKTGFGEPVKTKH